MSVHSHSAAQFGAATAGLAPARTAALDPTRTPEFPRHVVTAVVVSHDGARWLPEALSGLLGQERPVQNAVAADTGSGDESAQLLAEALGADSVLHLARRSGFGTAVEEAARTAGTLTPDDLPYLKRPSGWDPVSRTWRDDAYDMPELPHGEPVQWLWLLHDDCAPEPGALTELLRVVENEGEVGREVAVVGPKLRGWYDRRQLLEVGVSIANSGRRWTGLDRREQDQGQHDLVRPVLSVSTAGMLVRRDVFEELGGFDRGLPLMRDDVDLCWRAHTAGHRVLVAPEAVVRHAEAASRERRTVDCVGRSTTSPHRVDKAGAAHTLLANVRGRALPWVLVRLIVGTVVRTVAYLVGKVPGQALDEIAGLLVTLLRPGRILNARRARAKGTVEPGELRPLFPPPGATLRLTVEQMAGSLSGGPEPEAAAAGRHGVVESGPGGDDADYLQVEQFARLKRIARKPGPVLFAVLLVFSLIACRALIGGGSLAGGALLPAPESASELWSRYLDGWHTFGTGGTAAAPPYLALVATLASLMLGSTAVAVTLLLVCSVPLAGVTAYFASRSLIESRLLRAWAAVAYAFLPAATGALAGGRIGTAVLAVLLPLIARVALSAGGFAGHRGSWRATWAYALLLTVTTAFTPIVWPIALVLGIGVLAVRRAEVAAYGPRFVAVVATPLIVLAPWSLSLLPFGFFQEAGSEYGAGSADALGLLGMDPGGPGTLAGLLLIGIVLAALAALVRTERRTAVLTAWAVALVGLVFAVLSNRSAWAGPATLVYGLALLGAALIGAQGARFRVAEQSFGWRQPLAALIALAAAVGPLVAAVGWMVAGADGPLERRDPEQVPAFVAEESSTEDQPRTLVLAGSDPAEVSYVLVRGSGSRIGDAEAARSLGDEGKLGKVVSRLVAGSGADQADQLGGFAVRYVLVQDGAPREMSRVLDATPGLSRLSQQDGSALWRVDRQVARASIVQKGKEPQTVASGPVELHTAVPAGPAGRTLRIADAADAGWTATLNGKPLERTTVDGWAQGFALPAGGGHLDVTYDEPFSHTLWLWAQGALALVLVVLALPGRRKTVDDDLPEEESDVTAEPVAGEGRRARRLRAQAEAEAEVEAEAPADREGEPEQPGIPAQQQPGMYDVDAPQDWEAQPAYADHLAQPQQPADPYGAAQQPQQGGYEQPYQADPYESGQYDPYGYGGQSYGQQQYQQPYDQQPYEPLPDSGQQYDAQGRPYPPNQGDGHDRPPYNGGTDPERPDGSNQ
ncbi:glycosyltransferase [Streptomyces tsukubensis]|uniref:Family 2 glycosyl transferase n=1 Tax=Streptomyces tsukubensis TaxID=83656 RepID=A0A1V3ZZG6_9ACTN|nr:glycosyltransferase [Streptomyces tsukubensis]OON71300.1 family 2 glycosyl transferase [Streptomyces tsukubensis]QFR93946.1 glycosyltransferase [Streptomyces tsukubensis]